MSVSNIATPLGHEGRIILTSNLTPIRFYHFDVKDDLGLHVLEDVGRRRLLVDLVQQGDDVLELVVADVAGLLLQSQGKVAIQTVEAVNCHA